MKKIVYILCIFVFAILIISVFNIFDSKNADNSFVRNFKKNKIEFKHELQLKNDQFTFAGKHNSNIALRDIRDPSYLVEVDSSLKKIKRINLKVPYSFNIKGAMAFLNTYFDIAFLSNQFSELAIFNKDAVNSYKIDGLRFDFLQPISQNSVIVRAKKDSAYKKNRELTKLTISKAVTTDKKYLLPTQIDGYFCTDGWLTFDKENSRILYMYYYHGEFLCLDTNLNLLYKKKTIDTVTKANIKLKFKYVKGSNGSLMRSTTQATPPDNLINRYITTSKNSIYILSFLRADNESISEFRNNHSIDVYSIENGDYQYSFHIPRYKGKKFTNFKIIDNLLVAIFGEYLVTFSMN